MNFRICTHIYIYVCVLLTIKKVNIKKIYYSSILLLLNILSPLFTKYYLSRLYRWYVQVSALIALPMFSCQSVCCNWKFALPKWLFTRIKAARIGTVAMNTNKPRCASLFFFFMPLDSAYPFTLRPSPPPNVFLRPLPGRQKAFPMI